MKQAERKRNRQTSLRKWMSLDSADCVSFSFSLSLSCSHILVAAVFYIILLYSSDSDYVLFYQICWICDSTESECANHKDTYFLFPFLNFVRLLSPPLTVKKETTS